LRTAIVYEIHIKAALRRLPQRIRAVALEKRHFLFSSDLIIKDKTSVTE